MKTLFKEDENGDFTMLPDGKNIAEMDPVARIEYWQQQGERAIFDAAWKMIDCYCRENGIDPHIDRKAEFHSKNLSDKR